MSEPGFSFSQYLTSAQLSVAIDYVAASIVGMGKAAQVVESNLVALSAANKIIYYTNKFGKLVSWNPLDHPKDDEGKFVKKGTGTFLYGHTESAKYQVKSITISTPINVSLDLQPGDSVWTMSTGSIMVRSMDGKTTLHTAAGTIDSIPPKTALSIFKGGTPKLEKRVPFIEVEGADLDAAKVNLEAKQKAFKETGAAAEILMPSASDPFDLDATETFVTKQVNVPENPDAPVTPKAKQVGEKVTSFSAAQSLAFIDAANALGVKPSVLEYRTYKHSKSGKSLPILVMDGTKVYETGTGLQAVYPNGGTGKAYSKSGKESYVKDTQKLPVAAVEIETVAFDVKKTEAPAASEPKTDAVAAPEPAPLVVPPEWKPQKAAEEKKGLPSSIDLLKESAKKKALKTLEEVFAEPAETPAEKATKTLNKAAAVTATKYGKDAQGVLGWKFNNHVTADGEHDIFSATDPYGNIYLFAQDDGATQLAGPFAQMKDAKAWVSDNAVEGKAAKPGNAPGAFTVPLVPKGVTGKIKPAATAKPTAKKAAPSAPKAAPVTEASDAPEKPSGTSQSFTHPKYGVMTVNVGPDSKVYATGVGIVVVNPDDSGSITSGKTKIVTELASGASKKLPVSNTTELATGKAPEGSAVSSLESKVVKVKSIKATNLETGEVLDFSWQKAKADAKKVLDDLAKKGTSVNVKVSDPGQSSSTSFGPTPEAPKAEKPKTEKLFFNPPTPEPEETKAPEPEETKAPEPVSDATGAPLEEWEAALLYPPPEVSTEPNPPKVNPKDTEAAPTVATGEIVEQHAIKQTDVAPEWIKASKMPITGDEPAWTTKKYKLNGVYAKEGDTEEVVITYGGYWHTPWGWVTSIAKAKQKAIAYNAFFDTSVIKAPSAPKKKVAGKKGLPTNALGVPEVEWQGHRISLLPGMRIFASDTELHVKHYKGTGDFKMDVKGYRSPSNLKQTQLKAMGLKSIAYGGAFTYGKNTSESLQTHEWKSLGYPGTYGTLEAFKASDTSTTIPSLFLHIDVLDELGTEIDLDQMISNVARELEVLRTKKLHSWYQKDRTAAVLGGEYALTLLQLLRQEKKGEPLDPVLLADALAGYQSISLSKTPEFVSKLRTEFLATYLMTLGQAEGFNVGKWDDLNLSEVHAWAQKAAPHIAPALSGDVNAAKVWMASQFLTKNSQDSFKLSQMAAFNVTVAEKVTGTKYAAWLDPEYPAFVGEQFDKTLPADLYDESEGSTNLKAVLIANQFGVSAYEYDLYQIVSLLEEGNKVELLGYLGKPALESLDAHQLQLLASKVLHPDFNASTFHAQTVSKFLTDNGYSPYAYVPNEAFEQKFAQVDTTSLPSKADAPQGVPAQTWALVLGTLSQPAEDESKSVPDDAWKILGVSPQLLTDAPPQVAELMELAKTLGNPTRGEVLESLRNIARTGVWGSPWADEYTFEYYGHKHSLFLRPGDKVFKYSDYKYAVWNEFAPQSGYTVEAGYAPNLSYQTMGVDPASFPYYKEILAVPNVLSYETAKISFPSLSQTKYNLLMGAMDGSFDDASGFGVPGVGKGEALLAVKGYLATQADAYPSLKGQSPAAFPDGILRALYFGFMYSDTGTLEFIDYLAQYKYFNDGEEPSALDSIGFNPSASYASKIFNFTKDEIHILVPSESIDLFNDLTGSSINTLDTSALWAALGVDSWGQADEKIFELLQSKKDSGGVKKPKAASKQTDELVLTPINTGAVSGGSHTIHEWVDQNGTTWLSKPFPNDPNAKYRVDVEHTANDIARLYGYNAPATRTMMIDGKYSYVQLIAPASGTLNNKSWQSLHPDALRDAMSEHVIDWVLSNHDSHGGNLLLAPDGMGAFGIDKGQAGRFFGQDKLAEGYLPHTNPVPVWYDKVYAAIRTKQMSKEQADAVRDAVLKKAALVSTRNGESYRAKMLDAQKNRTQWPSKYPDAKAWVDAHDERRQATFDGFVELYKGLYEQAGYEWGDKSKVEDYLPKKVADRIHVAASDEYVADVSKSGSLGVPLFVSAGTFADDMIQGYVTKNPSGGQTFRADAYLLNDSASTFLEWLKQHTVVKVSPSANPNSSPETGHKALPGLDMYFPALVAYVKTVKTHIEDGKFNPNTVAGAETARASLQEFFDHVKATVDENPLALVKWGDYKFYTAEQQDNWLLAAEKMLHQFDLTTKAKEQGVPVSQFAPDDVPFTMPSYTPTPGIDYSGKPKVVAAYSTDGGFEYQKWSDGNYTFSSGDGHVKSDQSAFAYAAANGVPVTLEEAVPEQEDSSAVVSVANVPVKVSYQSASSFAGTFDAAGFEVKESGGSLQFTGKEYMIEFEGVKIRFQGTGDGIVRAQENMLRIEVADWDGTPHGVEKMLEVLRGTGLQIDEATEQSLEIGYWRRLHVLVNRRNATGKFVAAKAAGAKIAQTNDAAELEAWRTMWAGIYGQEVMDKFLAKQRYLALAGESRAGGQGALPHWVRPDSSVENFYEWSGGMLPLHDIAYGAGDPHNASVKVAKSGLFATEDRMRILGQWLTGASSTADQSHGSSGYAYFRQRYAFRTYSVYLEPEYAMAVSNYASNHDSYGNSDKKISQAPFGVEEQAKFGGGGSGELMVKHGVTPFDGIAVQTFKTETERKEVLDFYKALGITEIRGLPIEERFVVGEAAAKKTIEKVWAMAIAKEKEGAA